MVVMIEAVCSVDSHHKFFASHTDICRTAAQSLSGETTMALQMHSERQVRIQVWFLVVTLQLMAALEVTGSRFQALNANIGNSAGLSHTGESLYIGNVTSKSLLMRDAHPCLTSCSNNDNVHFWYHAMLCPPYMKEALQYTAISMHPTTDADTSLHLTCYCRHYYLWCASLVEY